MKTKCNKHPKYKGIKPPRAQCKDCVVVFINNQGLGNVLSEASILANISFNLSQCIGKPLTEYNVDQMKLHQVKFDQALENFNKNLKYLE